MEIRKQVNNSELLDQLIDGTAVIQVEIPDAMAQEFYRIGIAYGVTIQDFTVAAIEEKMWDCFARESIVREEMGLMKLKADKMFEDEKESDDGE